jgi:NAD(P)-dependent dehydrogenase (short-subunit alcohol dehydrogenase family)
MTSSETSSELGGPTAIQPIAAGDRSSSAAGFAGRSVVVTGGCGALGAAVVRRLVALGARVHVPWFSEGEVIASGLSAMSGVAFARVDLRVESEVQNFYASIAAAEGSTVALWASIHVAGGFAMAPAIETTQIEFERLFSMNATTAFLCSREAAKRMRGHGGGRIVQVAARPAVRPVGGMVAYAVSKAAVAALTEALAEEWRDEGILVNAVLPSIMNTPANRAAMPGADHASWPSVEAVAEAILFLASPANALTSGALLPVYGRA